MGSGQAKEVHPSCLETEPWGFLTLGQAGGLDSLWQSLIPQCILVSLFLSRAVLALSQEQPYLACFCVPFLPLCWRGGGEWGRGTGHVGVSFRTGFFSPLFSLHPRPFLWLLPKACQSFAFSSSLCSLPGKALLFRVSFTTSSKTDLSSLPPAPPSLSAELQIHTLNCPSDTSNSSSMAHWSPSFLPCHP